MSAADTDLRSPTANANLTTKRSGMRPTLPVLACLLALCGACDDTITVPDAPPEAEVTAYCTADDRTWFFIEVSDAEGQPVDVDLIVDGRRIPAGPAGDGFVGLRTDRNMPITHVIEWGQACSDCPDVCAAAPGPSEVDDCAALEGSAPAQINVTAHLDDATNRVVMAPMSVTLGACPE